jgi:hypothetical protein
MNFYKIPSDSFSRKGEKKIASPFVREAEGSSL